MNLFDIDASIKIILENGYDQETGEFSDEAWVQINELQLERDKKIESIALYIETLESEAEAINEKVIDLKERIEAKKSKASNLKSYLSLYLDSNDLDKFESPSVRIRFTKSKSVVIEDDDEFSQFVSIHPEMKLLRTKTTIEPDKKVIGDMLKAGLYVGGARLSENRNIIIK